MIPIRTHSIDRAPPADEAPRERKESADCGAGAARPDRIASARLGSSRAVRFSPPQRSVPMTTAGVIESFARDARQAVRGLRRSPLF